MIKDCLRPTDNKIIACPVSPSGDHPFPPIFPGCPPPAGAPAGSVRGGAPQGGAAPPPTGCRCASWLSQTPIFVCFLVNTLNSVPILLHINLNVWLKKRWGRVQFDRTVYLNCIGFSNVWIIKKRHFQTFSKHRKSKEFSNSAKLKECDLGTGKLLWCGIKDGHCSMLRQRTTHEQFCKITVLNKIITSFLSPPREFCADCRDVSSEGGVKGYLAQWAPGASCSGPVLSLSFGGSGDPQFTRAWSQLRQVYSGSGGAA